MTSPYVPRVIRFFFGWSGTPLWNGEPDPHPDEPYDIPLETLPLSDSLRADLIAWDSEVGHICSLLSDVGDQPAAGEPLVVSELRERLAQLAEVDGRQLARRVGWELPDTTVLYQQQSV